MQIFGSSLRQPWALVKHGDKDTPGKRPGTSVVYLTDRDGEDFYLGGFVEFYRARNEPFARWHYRYKAARRFAAHDIVALFPNPKSRDAGPAQSQVRAVKRKLTPNPSETCHDATVHV